MLFVLVASALVWTAFLGTTFGPLRWRVFTLWRRMLFRPRPWSRRSVRLGSPTSGVMRWWFSMGHLSRVHVRRHLAMNPLFTFVVERSAAVIAVPVFA